MKKLQVGLTLMPEGSPSIHERLEELRKSGRAQKMIDLILEEWRAEEAEFIRRYLEAQGEGTTSI